MADEFNGDLAESVFWGVDLSRARFRDVNLGGASMHNVWLTDVTVDGLVDRLVINGVDVTDYVNEHDPWQPLRGMLRPTDGAGMVATCAELERVWQETIGEVRLLGDDAAHASVGGEWSVVQTLRHLVFAIDKWFTLPLDGAEQYHPIGLPNTGSADQTWPGLNRGATPTLDEAAATFADRWARFSQFAALLTAADLQREVGVTEHGDVPIDECAYTIFEEAFEHRRYVLRDLATLAARP
jgi:hypothetical protein